MVFEYLPHTADIKFKAKGKDLEEVFSNAALATYNILTDVTKIKLNKKKKFKIKSKGKESLLYDFLERLIILIDSEDFIGGRVEVLRIHKGKKYTLIAELSGDDISKYETHGDIKAVTYSDMEIIEKKGNCYALVVLDI